MHTQPTLVNHSFQGTMHIDHEGERFYFTHKQGHHIRTGLPSSEYQSSSYARVWLVGSGAEAFVERD